MTRPLALACLLAAAHGWSPQCPGAAADQRMNVVLITADDLGLQLPCYGDPHIRTPNLDALAASGVRFETAYIAQSSCSPSRAAILTGLFPHANGHLGLAKPKNPPLHKELHEQTLPALLNAAGYRTGIIGKLHVNPAAAFPFQFSPGKESPARNSKMVRAVAAEAAKFFSAEPGRPFFLMVNYTDPHKNNEEDLFPARIDGIPESPLRAGDVPAWPFQRVEGDRILEHAANYYNCVLRLDTGVGLLLDALKSAGHEDRTLVIFLSDNGPPFARGKITCYEAGLRVPFLVRWPGVSAPKTVSDAFVSAVDILPTILDAAGRPAPATVQGRSLRPVLAGRTGGWRTELAAEFHLHGERPFYPRRALRDSRFKIIHNLLAGQVQPGASIDRDPALRAALDDDRQDPAARDAMARLVDPPEWELYDLNQDPWEFRNLAADPAHEATLRRMQSLLLDWRRETLDPFLDPAVLARTHADVNAYAVPSKKK